MKKINSVRRALGLWCAFLAAGGWIVPVGVVAAPSRISAAASVMKDGGEDGWSDSAVAAAWESATGVPFAPSLQVLALGGEPDGSPTLLEQVNPETGEGFSLGYFIVDDSLLAAVQDVADESGAVHGVAEVVIGRFFGGDLPARSFAGFRLNLTATSQVGTGVSQSGFLPIVAFPSAERADAYIAGLRAASDGTEDGNGGLGCINPNWIGSDGTQCCMLKAAYDADLRSCTAAYYARLVACMAAAIGIGATVANSCLNYCVPICIATLGAGCAPCLKACLLLTLASSLGSLALCELGNQYWLESCEESAKSDHIDRLADHGCPPKPAGSNSPRDSVSVLSEADTLTPVGSEN
jgi:hypothetical protein